MSRPARRPARPARALDRPGQDFFLRAVPRPVHRAAKVRAAQENRSLNSVLIAALRAYGAGEWDAPAESV